MSNDPFEPAPDEGAPQQPQPPQHISARVPDPISRGVFSTGSIVVTGGNEFVIDFVQNLGQPALIVARIVMPHVTMPQFIQALQQNIDNFTNRFGPPPELPKATKPGPAPNIQSVYDDLKLPDEMLSGSYANGVMISHTPSEFKFDFLTNLFPQTAVSARVILSAPQVPRMLESLKGTYAQFEQRVKEQQKKQQQPPPDDPPSTDPPESE